MLKSTKVSPECEEIAVFHVVNYVTMYYVADIATEVSLLTSEPLACPA